MCLAAVIKRYIAIQIFSHVTYLPSARGFDFKFRITSNPLPHNFSLKIQNNENTEAYQIYLHV